MICPPMLRWFVALTLASCSSAGSTGASDTVMVDGAFDSTITPDGAPWDGVDSAGPDTHEPHPPDATTDIVEPWAPPFPVELAEDLTAILDTELDGISAPGVTLTVVLPGHAPLELARGKARDEPYADMVVGDRFRTGSVTKTFVTAASLQMVAEGLIGLDDPIDLWVPGYNLGAGVTLRRLMNHTSGIPNYTDDPNFVSKVFGHGTPYDVIDFAMAMGLLYGPGGGFTYSNTNYYFLGLMVEAVTHDALDSVLRSRLLEPLDLDDIFMEGAETYDGTYVEGYLAGAPAPLTDMSWAWAAGAMVASGADLCTWLEVLYRGDVVQSVHRELMMTRTSLWGGSTLVDYGLGTQILDHEGRDLFGHSGATVGGQCFVYIEAESGACIALMSNDFFATPGAASDSLWSQVFSYLETH